MFEKPEFTKLSRLATHWELKPGTVFLNHGAFGACPRPILELQAELRRQMEAEPVQFLWRRYEERLEPSRRVLARFVGARPRDLVFVTNATTGVNAVLRSIPLRPGDELLTTAFDYNACRNALAQAAAERGAKLVVAPLPFPLPDEGTLAECVLDRVTRRTRLVMLDHVTSSTAVILPVERLVRELEARGIETLVDGAHAPGMLPLNLARLRPAYYTANLHKWVCAPKGAAFLWVREDLQKRMQPPVVSHGNNTPRPGYTPFQDRFDWAGTFDPTAWMCVGPAIEWMRKLLPDGWAGVRRRNHQLLLRARRLLLERLKIEPPCPESLLGSMATLPLPDRFQGRPRRGKLDSEQVALYDRFGIEVPFVRIGNPERRYFRISAQLYNSLPQYEYLAECLDRL
ncbi:MAG TPA: aminotransferase class V-fold PLP-dependent enzyme [Verrucomicrobiota bacterium]|nr:aminotransferase class V-fold PLP-dependent enzyme [Verrucomicrobiota bacterium]HRT07955.1 aminotransferase class V-fold PLP-dependent enzyme [Candidatus Paceibacterota bacterium]HRT57121.1 aminotransferase class V-fold PLP-dependent enzyme [Candidatus Paceibacterota bacterium]